MHWGGYAMPGPSFIPYLFTKNETMAPLHVAVMRELPISMISPPHLNIPSCRMHLIRSLGRLAFSVLCHLGPALSQALTGVMVHRVLISTTPVALVRGQ